MMNRRNFLKVGGAASAAFAAGAVVTPEALAAQGSELRTKHLIWLINGNGIRKKEYLEDATKKAP